MRMIDQALAQHRRGNIKEAESLYRQILKRDGRDFDALHMLGIICAQRGQFDEAERLLRTALSIDKTVPPCCHNYGNVLCKLKRYDDGIAVFNRAIALAPGYVPIYSDRGNAQMELRRFRDAVASYDQALALDPRYVPAHYNRANALEKLDRYDEALASYDRALALEPRYADALCNRGVVLRNMRRFDEALASFDKALAIRPDFAEAHFAESDLRLLTGDFARGFPEYEWRWKMETFSSPARNFMQPLWLGAPPLLDGKTILLHGEQGFGDTIQFCRYAPLLAAGGAQIILEVDKSLVELMRGVSGVAQIIAKGEPLPNFQVHCPLGSLPFALATRLATIPADVPYLAVPQLHREKWRAKLGPADARRIAVSWAGNANFKNDYNRSIGLHAMSPLFADSDVQFFSIQKDLRAGDAELLRRHPKLIQLGKEIESFSDTAAIVSLMDAVISSDTSVVHLAGALAAPIWTLLAYAPDWRWLLGRDDCPWYPTMRLFRQTKPGDWASVIAAAAKALATVVPRRAEQAAT